MTCFQNLIATIMLWASALTAVKLSLLLLYARVFSIRKFCIAAYAVMPLVFGWWLSVFLEELLLCRPLAYNWDKTIRGSCADISAAYLAAGILNLLSDVSVLVLPIPIVLSLHLPLRSRIVLVATFCVGLLLVIPLAFSAFPARNLLLIANTQTFEKSLHHLHHPHPRSQSIQTRRPHIFNVDDRCLEPTRADARNHVRLRAFYAPSL